MPISQHPEIKAHVINLKSLDQDISDPVIAGGGDVNGRTLRIILSQEAKAQLSENTNLYLKWRHKQLGIKGYNVFQKVNDVPYVWEIHWPSAMLRQGDVLACIELVDDISISPSVNFMIHVLEDPIGNSGFTNSDDWSEFQKAILRLQELEDKIKRIESLETIETTSDYTVEYNIGDLRVGDIIPKGRTFDQFVKHLVTDYQALKYQEPTLTNLSIYENEPLVIGAQGTINFSFNFKRNDAGPISKINFICENDDTIHLTSTVTQPGGGPNPNGYSAKVSFLVPDKTLKIAVEVEYKEGDIKTDKFGEEVPGHILAGKIRSQAVRVSAKKFTVYHYFTTDEIPTDLSDNFPDTSKLSKVEDLIQGDTVEISVIEQAGNLVFYIPKDGLTDPKLKRPQAWYFQGGPAGWSKSEENPNPTEDPLAEQAGYYRYQIRKPNQSDVYRPSMRVEL